MKIQTIFEELRDQIDIENIKIKFKFDKHIGYGGY